MSQTSIWQLFVTIWCFKSTSKFLLQQLTVAPLILIREKIFFVDRGGGIIFDGETKQRQQELLVWAIVVCLPNLLRIYQVHLRQSRVQVSVSSIHFIIPLYRDQVNHRMYLHPLISLSVKSVLIQQAPRLLDKTTNTIARSSLSGTLLSHKFVNTLAKLF